MRYSDSPLELTIKAWDIVFLPRINNLIENNYQESYHQRSTNELINVKGVEKRILIRS